MYAHMDLTTFPELPSLLPTGWFRKGSFNILQSCRKLAGKQITLPNSFHKCGVPLQFFAVMLVGVEDSDWHEKLLSDDPYWLGQVGFVRYQHSHFELLLECIPNEM